MKNNAIVRIMIWSLVLILLVGILVVFIFPWLILDSLLHDNPPAETAIPVPLATQPDEVPPVRTLPNEGNLRINADTIREIEINWAAGDILISAADIEEIKISESDLTDEKYALVWKVKGDELCIDFCENSLTGIHAVKFPSKDLYIEVPADWICDAIEIDAASATLEMQNLTLKTMDFDGASGACNFQNCHISDLDIDTASGDVYYAGTLDVLDFDGASASFTGDLQNTPNRIDMDSMSGKLDIALPEDCGFTATMDGMNCTFRSDFQSAETKNKSHVYGDGRCRINVDGMSCDVTIRKLDSTLLPAAEAAPAIIDPTEEPTVPCTGPNCGDPACPEHHGSADCTDPTCPRHHAVSPGHHQEPHSGHH